ncbi:MAG: DUF5667 domain-containing protein [Patescibacteria group bacterium]
MRWNAVRQLKSLRGFPVPPGALVSGRLRLVARIEAAPMLRRPSAWFMAAAWRPAVVSMIVAVVATGGGTVVAAHDALPGEALYALKLAAENVRERVAVTSKDRFAVQAAHASSRLAETEELLERQELGEEDRAARVRAAMDRYEGHVFVLNEIAAKMEDVEDVREKARKTAEGMVDRHMRLVESATRAEASVASIMLDPIVAALSLEDDLAEQDSTDDVGDGDDDREGGLRRRERAEKIGEGLKRMRVGLEDRRKRDDPSSGRENLRQDDDADERAETR